MLDSSLLGKLLLRHAGIKPRFNHRAHDLGFGLKGIPFLPEKVGIILSIFDRVLYYDYGYKEFFKSKEKLRLL